MDFLVKRGRGLDPAVLGWLMGTLGIGPGIGEVHFLVKADSAYYSWLRDDMRVNPSLIHYSAPDGEDAMVANRNDVLCVYPGDYAGVGANPFTWSKNNTHLIGMTAPLSRAVQIWTYTVDGVFAMNNTADHCQFHNIRFSNWGEHANCLTAVKETGHHNLYKGIHMQGEIRSEQVDVVGGCSLWIDTPVAGAGEETIFDGCLIGDTGGSIRDIEGAGVIHFGPTGAVSSGKNMVFRRCKILSRSTTASCVAVRLAANNVIDRLLFFENTLFYNFYDAAQTKLTEVFWPGCGTGHRIVLKECVNAGWSSWQSSNVTYLPWNAMPTPNAEGGITTESG